MIDRMSYERCAHVYEKKERKEEKRREKRERGGLHTGDMLD